MYHFDEYEGIMQKILNHSRRCKNIYDINITTRSYWKADKYKLKNQYVDAKQEQK